MDGTKQAFDALRIDVLGERLLESRTTSLKNLEDRLLRTLKGKALREGAMEPLKGRLGRSREMRQLTTEAKGGPLSVQCEGQENEDLRAGFQGGLPRPQFRVRILGLDGGGHGIGVAGKGTLGKSSRGRIENSKGSQTLPGIAELSVESEQAGCSLFGLPRPSKKAVMKGIRGCSHRHLTWYPGRSRQSAE